MADSEDKKVLDIVRAQDKDVADLLDHLLSSAGNITFPINDEKEFVKAMGGANTQVSLGNRQLTIGHLAAKVPAYYFPIADEHELIAKLADLSLQQRSPASGSAAAGKLMPATAASPGHGPPNIPHDEFQKVMDANPGLHIVGVKKP